MREYCKVFHLYKSDSVPGSKNSHRSSNIFLTLGYGLEMVPMGEVKVFSLWTPVQLS